MADGDPSEFAEITRLDDRTVREIAAGEVVERPASVVKELVENALDAGANRVAVTVENGGIDGIRVRDDGHGMTPEQLPEAVAEHTTSKLDGMAQLDDGIGTLGFRGEALYTVGAVARLTVRSRSTGQETGAELVVDHGEQSDVRAVGCPGGTTVEVRELFAETPARRKFLKKPATEFDRVNGIASAYALANPDIAVSLEHDDREVFASPGDGDLRSAVLAVYGREVAESMIDVGHGEKESTVSVTGVVSDPETTRASRSYVTTFVNGRWVQDSDLRSAVVEAYGGQLAADRYPFAVLFLTVPPAAVDANVHPRKTEVRFDDEADVIETVQSAVRESLLDAGLLRTGAPRGRSAPEETQLDPEIVGGSGTEHERRAKAEQSESGGGDGDDSNRDRGDRNDSNRDRGRNRDSNRDNDDSDNDDSDRNDSDNDDSDRDDEPDSDGSDESSAADTVLDAWDDSSATEDAAVADPPSREGESDESGEGASRHATDETPMASDGPSPRGWQRDGDSSDDNSDDGAVSEAADPDRRRTENSVGGLPSQHTLSGGTTDEWTEYDTLPRLRLLGQYDDTYLVCATAEGLVLVDQHAADERVNYERLRRAVGIGADGADGSETESSGTVQALAEPVEVPLTAREAALFERFRDALAAAGFHAERAEDGDADDGNAVRVTAVPAVFDATLDPELLRDTLVSFAENVAGSDRPAAAAADDLLADLACYPSITGNTSLTAGSVTELLAALDECENPYACPHGRPVIVRFDAEEVEDRFERDYPGHAGRREE
jgi:DNA mismatch repair protein MutL